MGVLENSKIDGSKPMVGYPKWNRRFCGRDRNFSPLDDRRVTLSNRSDTVALHIIVLRFYETPAEYPAMNGGDECKRLLDSQMHLKGDAKLALICLAVYFFPGRSMKFLKIGKCQV